MPEVIFMIGAPGSGKSTYINKINSSGKYVVISSDDILEELAAVDGINYNQAFDRYVGFATKEMFRRAEAAIASGKNVIWDQTNMNIKNRKKKLAMFPDTYEKKAVVFSLDDMELKRRLEKRAKETGKVIPGHVINSMQSSFEAPSKSEGFSKIEWVRK